jgi:D-xylose transport system substrate-binding protein
MTLRNVVARTFGASIILTCTAIGLPAFAKTADGKLLVAVSFQRQQEQRWAVDRAVMEAEAAKHNVELRFEYANGDPIKQASQVESLLARDPDVLIICPVNGASAGPIVKSAKESGVPVIAYDGGVTTAKVDFYITRDNYQVGVLQAKEALKFAPKGNYAMIKGDTQWQELPAFVKGWKDVLQGNESIKVVFDQYTTGWSPTAAQAHAENALSANSDNIAAFMVMNDSMATGTVQALRSRNLEGKVFVSGNDAETPTLKLIKSGAQTMSVYTDINDFGSSAIKAAIALANKQVPPHEKMVDHGAGEVPTHIVPIVAVTKDNLCEVVKSMAKGWTSPSEVFGDPNECK